jgi:DNA-binding MarR family transcriptional regulator
VLVVRAAKVLVEQAKRETLRAGVDDKEQSVEPLTVVHGLAIRYLDRHVDVTTVELAHHLGVTKQSASEIVGALEQSGLVRRHRHPEDGRARTLKLTSTGHAKLEASRARWRGVEERWADLVGSEELRHVRLAIEAYLAAHAEDADLGSAAG